jgi:hypothetical protein
MMDVPTAQEKSEQIFFTQPEAHQNKFANLNKMVPADPLRMIAFFEQCQATNKAAGVLEEIAKGKKQPKEKSAAHVPTAHSHESSYKQHHCHKYRDYHRSDRIVTIANLTIIIETINAMIMVNAKTRTQGTTSPTTRRMISSAITSRKRATRPCTMTSPLCQVPAICPQEGVDLIPDLLRALILVLALAQAAGATKTIMLNNMIAS